MTLVAILAGLQCAVVALLLLQLHRGRHHADPNLVELIALIDRLCQRVQAPQAAVLEHHEAGQVQHGPEYAPPAIPPDDDEAYWESRENLAERLMREEVESGR